MPVHLYLAPAAAGKTTYVLKRVRQAAQRTTCTPRVCLPTSLQVRAWRRRLAEAGGTLGVRLLTFDRLYAECLNAAGPIYVELSDPVQYRVIRGLADELPLRHYAPLIDRPGFIQLLQGLFGELKGARVYPAGFAEAVAALGNEARLHELAQIYSAYQERLQAHAWADRAGMGWLAVATLESTPAVAGDWPLLVVDGFDSFTPVQIALLKALAGRVGEMIITLTGAAGSADRPVYRRFDQTRRQLEKDLALTATALPESTPPVNPVLAHLEDRLFRGDATPLDAAGVVELTEAPDQAAEVRAALRWLKARLINDGMRPGDVALLARDISPYRPFILQTATEFGLPLRLVDGLPLRTNPAVAALLDLLRLMLPRPGGGVGPALPRRLTIEAWRCPYLDWTAWPAEDTPEPIGIGPGDADALDAAARWGRVIGGHAQWEEALTALADRSSEATEDTEPGLPAGVPGGPAARTLLGEFRRFVRRLTPPTGARSYADLVGWLEGIIGPDVAGLPEHGREPGAAPLAAVRPLAKTRDEPTSLQIVARARDSAETTEQDVAALQALKDVLRGLVWAEEAVAAGQAVDYPRFVADLAGAVEATSFLPPAHADREEILVANVIQARGVPFRAVAVLGLAEGAFPATLTEDVLLRDADRQRLREQFGLPLDPSTASAEVEFFYETVTRAWERLLLTRPRLADNGIPWQASPFWEEARRLVQVEPATLTSETIPQPAEAASWSELLESLVRHADDEDARAWVQRERAPRWAMLESATQLLRLREAGADDSPFDGDLGDLAQELGRRFGPDHTWSASRLESYRACPFLFFIGSVLRLEPRDEPAEGLDARQLGTIYHRIFEEVYQDPAIADPTDPEQLRAALPAVARRILDEAPQRDGFRETAWWEQTRAEIEANVAHSLEALAALAEGFAPHRYEAAFGFGGEPPLIVGAGEDCLRLHGYIDRVDRALDGRLRIIDYKTSGPYEFTPRAVAEGKKLQLPLYARAARDALQLGEVAEGFYWHVRHARPSEFTLSRFAGGAEAALDVAVEKAREAVWGIRRGHFAPHPPEGGCPPYCPAAAFCWHYQGGYGG